MTPFLRRGWGAAGAQLWALLDRAGRVRVVGFLGLMLVGALWEGVGIALLLPVLTMLGGPGAGHPGRGLAWAGRVLEFRSPEQSLLVVLALLAAVYLLKALFLGWLYSAQSRFIFARQAELSERLFRRYLSAPYTQHIQRNTAELLFNTAVAVTNVFGGILLPLMILLTEACAALVVVAVVLFVTPAVAVWTLGLLGAGGALLHRVLVVRMEAAGKARDYHLGRMYRWVSESLGGLKEIRVFRREAYFERMFRAHMTQYAQAASVQTVGTQLPRLFMETVVVAGLLGGATLVVWGGGTAASLLPSLGVFGVAVMRLMPSVNRIFHQVANMTFHRPSLEVVWRDLTAPAEAPAGPSPVVAESSWRLAREIRLDHIGFRYPGTARPALDGIALAIPRGAMVAFVGRTGAGKTTLADVLLGLLEPTEGRVLADGADIRERLPVWQGQIGYIPQSIFLLDDTLRRNVAFGLDDGEIDERRVRAAIRAADLEEVVDQLPQGPDTVVGERGIRLSGGQRQRVAIARALYGDPAVLILDEATSALDPQTETRISEAIGRLAGHATVVVIAHRVSTMRRCERLCFLSAGRLVAEGRFDDLVRTSGEFREMVEA